jgi:lysophospholipase L1-like esterase
MSVRAADLGFLTGAALLAPLLWYQGRTTRRVTPRLPEPDGARAGQSGSGAPLRLLILGDSAAAGVGAPNQALALSGRLVEQLSPRYTLDWRLLARSGDRTCDAQRALAADPGLRCDVVLTSLGANDVTALSSVAAFLAAQRTLADALRARGARLLLLSGLPPMHAFPALPQPLRAVIGRHARRLDAALAEWSAAQPDCEHLPFGELPAPSWMASDGFHPGPPIYAAWAERAAARIAARWPSA